MSETLRNVCELHQAGKLRISDHAYDEMIEDGLFGQEIIDGLSSAVAIEDYPAYAKGPCVLVLQMDAKGSPVHALWGIPKGATEPAVLITVYRPDPAKWDKDCMRRI